MSTKIHFGRTRFEGLQRHTLNLGPFRKPRGSYHLLPWEGNVEVGWNGYPWFWETHSSFSHSSLGEDEWACRILRLISSLELVKQKWAN